MTRARHGRRVPWGPVLMLVFSVVVSGALLQLDLGSDQGTRRYPTAIGQVGTLNNGERVVVRSYEVASATTSGTGKVTLTTSDVILVVHLTLEVDTPAEARGFEVLLSSGDRRHRGASTLGKLPQPGFRKVTTAVFEIPAEDLAGATVELTTFDLFRFWDRKVVVDLDISDQQAQELAAYARTRVVQVEDDREELQ